MPCCRRHSGAATGLSCVLLRNLTRDQTVIVFDNTHSNAHEIASRALKILNGQAVTAPRKSAARLYVRTLLKDGPDAAHQLLPTLRNEAGTIELSEDEMNSMGYELMGANNYYHLPTTFIWMLLSMCCTPIPCFSHKAGTSGTVMGKLCGRVIISRSRWTPIDGRYCSIRTVKARKRRSRRCKEHRSHNA